MSSINLQKRDFNFFSTEIESKNSQKKRRIIAVFLILVYLVLVAGAYYIFELNIRSIGEEIDILEEYLISQDISSQRKLAEEKRQEVNNLKQYFTLLESFLNEMKDKDIIGTKYIEQITSAVPQDLYFENLSMTANQLQIQGTAPNRQIIAEYLNNMKLLDLFSDVHISNITTISQPAGEETDAQSSYSFVMSCQLKDVMEE